MSEFDLLKWQIEAVYNQAEKLLKLGKINEK